MIDLTGKLKENQDNYSILQSALDKGGKILLPQGRFPVYKPLFVGVNGTTLVGEGGTGKANTPSSMLIAKNNIECLFYVSAESCHFSDIVLWGNGLDPITGSERKAEAKYGFVFQHASESLVIKCGVHAFASHGIKLENKKTITLPQPYNSLFDNIRYRIVGINDFIKFYACTTESNGGCGVYFEKNSPDNSGIEFIGLNCRFNGRANKSQGTYDEKMWNSHGMLVRGYCNKIVGGHFAYNGGYGIQLSEKGELGGTAGSVIIQPWLEDNEQNELVVEKRKRIGIMSEGQSMKSHIFTKDDFTRVELGENSSDYAITPSNEPFMQIQGKGAAIEIGAKDDKNIGKYAQIGAIQRYQSDANSKVDLLLLSKNGIKQESNGDTTIIKSNIALQPYGGQVIIGGFNINKERFPNREIALQTIGEIITEGLLVRGKYPSGYYYKLVINDSVVPPQIELERI
ncbi:MAG: hypothetical protein HUU34_12345 [Saprospiraceae bacterium]|nr:hypothetical protein [Saprospiraceae bacterium]